MRSFRLALSGILLFAYVNTYAQSTETKPGANAGASAGLSLMKSLAGTWQGSLTTDSAAWATDKPLPLSIQVASHGNAVIHELNTGGPEVTVFFVEGERLALVHYCDFGNRPHMIARPSADAKVIEFDLLEVPGSDQIGHVSHAVFTVVDTDHHIENWTFLPAGQKPVHAHFDFKRVKAEQTQASQ